MSGSIHKDAEHHLNKRVARFFRAKEDFLGAVLVDHADEPAIIPLMAGEDDRAHYTTIHFTSHSIPFPVPGLPY